MSDPPWPCEQSIALTREALDMSSAAVQAAREVAERFGIVSPDPLVLQETNNTVVWLRPEPVIAKVAVRAPSHTDIRLEHAMAIELSALGAEVARPMTGTLPVQHSGNRFLVTLWERLEGADRAAVAPAELAGSLRRLHAALSRTEVELPSFTVMVTNARRALDDDSFVIALPHDDRDFLRRVYDEGLGALERARFNERRLHGEPHSGNRIRTSQGLRWIDFESCSLGPLEWDLAFQPEVVVDQFPEADSDLLALLRRLNSARVATWCWGGAHHPEMRHHGEQHVALLRRARMTGDCLEIP